MRRVVLPVVLTLIATGASIGAPTARAADGVDVTGHWVGTWSGYGIMDIAREQNVTADLAQEGRYGHGTVIFDGVNAATSVPLALRDAGATGIRVVLRVSGSHVLIEHELGGDHFTAKLDVDGDRMTGRVRGSDPTVYLVLTRARAVAGPGPAPGTPSPSAPTPPSPENTPPRPTTPPGTPPPARTPADVAVAPDQPATSQPTATEAGTRPAPKDFHVSPELKPVYFDFDKSDIRPDDAKLLDASAQWLKEHPDARVLIEGHADERGTSEYNLALGERRARATRDYLISHGVAGDRISTVSYGEQRPACTEKNEVCWTLNRRAEFLVDGK